MVGGRNSLPNTIKEAAILVQDATHARPDFAIESNRLHTFSFLRMLAIP